VRVKPRRPPVQLVPDDGPTIDRLAELVLKVCELADQRAYESDEDEEGRPWTLDDVRGSIRRAATRHLRGGKRGAAVDGPVIAFPVGCGAIGIAVGVDSFHAAMDHGHKH
jgi:hypothetical protein